MHNREDRVSFIDVIAFVDLREGKREHKRKIRKTGFQIADFDVISLKYQALDFYGFSEWLDCRAC